MNRLPLLLAAQAGRLPFFGGDGRALPFRQGLSNIAIKVNSQKKDYLVKFAVAPASKPSVFIQADYEKKTSGKISSLGISPRFLSFGNVVVGGRRFPYSIQEFVRGREIDYSHDLPALARTLHTLHSGSHGKRGICDYRAEDPAGYLIKNAKKTGRRESEATNLLEVCTQKAVESLSANRPGKDYLSLIHNDLTPENIIVANGRALLIDWGWAMYSSAAFDLCNALSPFTTSWTKPTFLSDGQILGFLDAYFKYHGIPDSRIIWKALASYWLTYNALLGNWIYNEFLLEHSKAGRAHLEDESFLAGAIMRAISLQKTIEKAEPYK